MANTGQPVAVPRRAQTIDPRIRERRLAVRHAAMRRRRRLVAATVALVALVAAAWGVTRSPLLRIRHAGVVGNAHTPTAEILAVANVRNHQMTDVAPGAIAGSLERLPWVLTARVTKHWPQTLTIVITERHPVAVTADAQGGSAGWALLDTTGRVLATISAAPGGLPVVTLQPEAAPAPAALASSPGSQAAAVLGPALVVAAVLPPTLAARVITVDPTGQVSIDLTSGAHVLLGTTEQLPQKLTALATVLAHVGASGATVDVRVPSAPVVIPPASTPPASTAPALTSPKAGQ